jgi:flavin-dependent dehydrogenase
MRAGPVRIAGAGPAGLSAAFSLARAGIAVEVRERRSVVGGRFRGCVHGIENWSTEQDFSERLGEWALDLSSSLTPCHELLLCNEQTSRRIRSSVPLFYLVSRGPDESSLEAALLRRARDAGADVRLGTSFPPGCVDLDATGPSSSRRVCMEAGIKFRTRSPDLAAALVVRSATPAGYAYLLIRSGVGSLCVVRFDGKTVVREQLRECERWFRRHVSFDVEHAKASAGYGTFSLHPELQAGASFCIGEAAGLQDFLWGFGIRRALESGALAARCLLEASHYPSLARREFELPDRASVVNRYLWDKTAALGFRPYVSLMGRHEDVRAALRRSTRQRLIHKLLYPLASARLARRFPRLGL